MKKDNVLSGQREFDRVYNKGQSYAYRHVVVFYNKNFTGKNRISFVASKKVGNAVQRNRSRRLMREAVRLSNINIEGYDFIFIARKSIVDQDMFSVKLCIENLIRRIEKNIGKKKI
ncbi:MAG: ribonuclease P protein component [Eubacteriales bacterium]|nr:ribonuclease P protein component [Eubacteriales bacterium]MDY3332446.1 ribonuclease P protein component [Gallibacter sp.]